MRNLYHARMDPVFVESAPRPEGAEREDAQVVLAGDLATDRAAKAGAPAMAATSRIALRRDGPFLLVADALEASAPLRDRFAEGLDLDVARRWKTFRFTLLLGLIPLGLLVEVDRQLGELGTPGAYARMIGDLFVLVVAAADLLRRTPRHPRTIAIVLLAAAMRFALFLAKACGNGHAMTYAAFTASLAAAAAILVVAPTPSQVVAATLAKLGISAADVRATRIAPRPSIALVVSACAAGVALPLLLAGARWAGFSSVLLGIFFAAFAAFVPTVIEIVFERRARVPRFSITRVLAAVALAFALTLGLSGVARHGIDAGAQVSRCVDPGAFSGGVAKRLIDAQNQEVSRNVPRGDGRWPLVLMNVLLVPLVEERVYRGLVQRILAARFGPARGIGAAALMFGLAHLGVYQIAVYQTALLGVSFGVAYASGGLVAAVIVHAAWNLMLMLR
jgi:membrane protease YdiL (CAAX protease family)